MKHLKRYSILLAIGLSLLICTDAGMLILCLYGILPSFAIIAVVLFSLGIFLTTRGALPFLEEIKHILAQDA